METVRIYHNPRCSKSRDAMKLLEARGIQPEVIHYLDQPPTAAELEELLAKLGLEPLELMRRSEKPFRELNLAAGDRSREELIRILVDHPILIERPIVVHGDRAVVARPPERLEELL